MPTEDDLLYKGAMGNRTPLISNARVIAVDVAHRRLTVNLPSTQILTVRMSYEGAADGLRVNHKPMPGRGTEGLVVFPGGDNRNGFWLKAIYPSAMDALTTDTDQFMEYDSHWSGHFHMLDQGGNFTEAFADGSFLQVGSGTTLPATFRHTVDTAQKRQTVGLPQSERVPSPPAPFNITLSHVSGTKTAIDPAGNVSVTGAPGASLTHVFGGTTWTIDKNGNVSSTGASGATLTLSFGGNQLIIDSAGVHVKGPLDATDNVTAGSGGADQVDLLGHEHKVNGVQGGSGSVNTTAPIAGT